METTTLTSNVGSSTFYFTFLVELNSYQIDYWYIDNVLLESQSPTTDDNRLDWTLSADDGAGADDVLQYNIYRADNSGGPWTTLVTSLPAGTVTYTDPSRGEFDGTNWWYVVRAEDTVGNEETNTAAVPEIDVVVTPYAIGLTGKSANSWVFVSFPSVMSGAINTILNDATAGDGLTTWTVAKWYNPQTPNDPWKTYRVGGTSNDMPTLTNTMGVWLWITANGGDQKLTLSSYAANSTGTVNINLYVGWNMVGYPSATSRLASSTLPAVADWVSVWQVASPYLTDYSNKALVTMSAGNAYWVHVTADVMWAVFP